jgi:WbqC-like protein
MSIAISQPTYLPWLGYFDLIDQVDQFILLDDAQFGKQSWDQRNRIKSPSALQWLTVPVITRGRLGQRLCDVEISDPRFWEKQLRAIEVSYGKAQFFDLYFPQVKALHCQAGPKLVDLNLKLIEWIASELGITTPMVRSSSLQIEGKRSERLVLMCKRMGANDYLSPRTAIYLLEDLPIFAESGINVWFHNYSHPEYKQRFPPFCSYASVLDLLFNEGPRSLEIIRSGRGHAFTPEQIRAMPAELDASIATASALPEQVNP